MKKIILLALVACLNTIRLHADTLMWNPYPKVSFKYVFDVYSGDLPGPAKMSLFTTTTGTRITVPPVSKTKYWMVVVRKTGLKPSDAPLFVRQSQSAVYAQVPTVNKAASSNLMPKIKPVL